MGLETGWSAQSEPSLQADGRAGKSPQDDGPCLPAQAARRDIRASRL